MVLVGKRDVNGLTIHLVSITNRIPISQLIGLSRQSAVDEIQVDLVAHNVGIQRIIVALDIRDVRSLCVLVCGGILQTEANLCSLDVGIIIGLVVVLNLNQVGGGVARLSQLNGNVHRRIPGISTPANFVTDRVVRELVDLQLFAVDINGDIISGNTVESLIPALDLKNTHLAVFSELAGYLSFFLLKVVLCSDGVCIALVCQRDQAVAVRTSALLVREEFQVVLLLLITECAVLSEGSGDHAQHHSQRQHDRKRINRRPRSFCAREAIRRVILS